MSFNIKIYRKFEKNLETKWRLLENNNSLSPFQSYDWQSHWYNTVGKNLFNLDANIVVIEVKNKVTDIFPLCIKKSWCYLIR